MDFGSVSYPSLSQDKVPSTSASIATWGRWGYASLIKYAVLTSLPKESQHIGSTMLSTAYSGNPSETYYDTNTGTVRDGNLALLKISNEINYNV